MENIKKRLTELLENCSSPYYNYKVVSIVECHDGKRFEGVNVETSSPSAGICAERNALYSAIAAGYKKGDFKQIYLMAGTYDELYPCFICRQALNDYCDKNTKIIIFTKDDIVTTTVEELCVHAFGDDDLKSA